MGETPTPRRILLLHTVAFCVACVLSCAASAQTTPEWAHLVGRNVEVRHVTPEGESAAASGVIGPDGTAVITAGDAVVGIVLTDAIAGDVTFTQWAITHSTTIDNEATTLFTWDGRDYGGSIDIDDDMLYFGETGFEMPGGITQRTSMVNAGIWYASGVLLWWIFIVSYRRRSWSL